MANYVERRRTNYFGVTDPEKLREIIRNCRCDDGDDIDIAEKTDKDTGETKYAILCDGIFDGMKTPKEDCDKESCLGCNRCDSNDEDDDDGRDSEIDAFQKAIQEILKEGDAMIMTTIGYEKLCCLNAYIDVVTKDAIDSIDLTHEGLKLARGMLGDPGFQTKSEY